MSSRELGRLERCVCANLIKFSKTKCQVLHPVKAVPSTNTGCTENGLTAEKKQEKNLGVLFDEKLDMARQCEFTAQKANRVLGSIRRSVSSRLRKVIFHLYSALRRPHLQYSIQLWSPQHKRDMELLK